MSKKSQSTRPATRSRRKVSDERRLLLNGKGISQNSSEVKRSGRSRRETWRKKDSDTSVTQNDIQTQEDKAVRVEPSARSILKAGLKKKKKKGISEIESNRNEYDKALGRFKGQISRFRQEQALIMAYDAEGWKGASKEKIKPHAEITRARDSIAKCLEMIKDCIRICDEASGDKSIPAEYFDEDGELDADNIFCGKCLKSDSTDDNDIIMCDGMCDRAYHMKCVFPPVDASVLEDDSDEGWLCPACDRKIDMIDEINDEFGTDYDYEDSWEKILMPGSLPEHEIYDFKTSAECKNTAKSWLDNLELPSEDESDEDFWYAFLYYLFELQFLKTENVLIFCSAFHSDTSSEASDLDSSQDNVNDTTSGSTGVSDSCVSEDLHGDIQDVDLSSVDKLLVSNVSAQKEAFYKLFENEEPEILNGKRKRSRVDYAALNKELFGDTASPDMKINGQISQSDDEEDGDAIWSPTKKRK